MAQNLTEKLPEELLLRVAENLYEPGVRISKDSTAAATASQYADLLNFCHVNKVCGRVGQEALLRNCNLTTSPYRQPALLLRTLLEKPTLARMIRSFSMFDTGYFKVINELNRGDLDTYTNCDVHAPTLAADEWRYVQSCMMEHLQTWDIQGPARTLLYHEAGASYPSWAIHCLLLSMATNVRHLILRKSLAQNEFIAFMRDLSALPSFSFLQSVERLTVDMDNLPVSEGLNFLSEEFWLLQLPKLKSLELNADFTFESAAILLYHQGQNLYNGTLHSLPQGASSALTDLTLSGWAPPAFLKAFLATLTAVKRLTYHPLVRPSHNNYQSANSEPTWDILLPMKDTLEHLKTVYEHNTRMWPRNLEKFTSLKKLELCGVFQPRSDLVHGKRSASDPSEFLTLITDFFPPNLEHLVLAPESMDIRWFALGESSEFKHLISGLEEFLPRARIFRPNLKSILLGGAKRDRCSVPDDYRYFDEELLELMQGGVVYLTSKRAWDSREGRKEKEEKEQGKEVFDFIR